MDSLHALCISVNEVVVHGFPGNYELRETDIISIDCGVYYKGFHSDSAYTYPLEGVSAETLLLLNRTYESLYLGIAASEGRKQDRRYKFCHSELCRELWIRCSEGVGWTWSRKEAS